MVIKHRAVPLDPKDKSSALAPSERFIFRAEDKVFWTRKNVGAGRVADLIATQLKRSSTKALFLAKESGDRCQNDLSLSSQLVEGGLVTLCEEDI
ncbi:Glucose-6-phosphate isomerase [Mycena indigotica]|uniref:Glucose-6-phosphate isomerase n=1 Tax=Mycena indigotica TaxID=2126181 RepID=A0A8H6VVA1_9AGAR|nr:Glucose-6-phosphate isomerase [Mycena indigotica]KAF7295244.1 Glucose-6-phosphate isomerase [Mycena indigotica]